MADWNDLKRAFERELNKEENKFQANEEELLNSIANYIAAQKGGSALHEYSTAEILDFLQKPASEVKECIGGEWLNMDDTTIDLLIYSLTKKVKKSADFLG